MGNTKRTHGAYGCHEQNGEAASFGAALVCGIFGAIDAGKEGKDYDEGRKSGADLKSVHFRQLLSLRCARSWPFAA